MSAPLPGLDAWKIEHNLATTIDLLERGARLITDLLEDDDHEYTNVALDWLTAYNKLAGR